MQDIWCMMHAWCMTMQDIWCMMHAWCMMHDAGCMIYDVCVRDVCFCVLRSITSWERFFENNRAKTDQNQPTNKQGTNSKQYEPKVRISRNREAKHVITSMGRVVSPWGAYLPT
jgi:hypothetical protein